MSFIAQRPVRPAESDVTDVDDGGAQIAVGTFWPTVKLHDLRLAARIAGDITTSRLMHMATEAALHVADQLKDWRKQREAEGAESLASVLLTSTGEPVEQINGESAKVYRFRRAVYSFTRASVLEGYRDVGTTPKGDKDAEAPTGRSMISGGTGAGVSRTFGKKPVFMRSCSDESQGVAKRHG